MFEKTKNKQKRGRVGPFKNTFLNAKMEVGKYFTHNKYGKMRDGKFCQFFIRRLLLKGKKKKKKTESGFFKMKAVTKFIEPSQKINVANKFCCSMVRKQCCQKI